LESKSLWYKSSLYKSTRAYNKLIYFLTQNGFKKKEINQFISLLNDYENAHEIQNTFLLAQEKLNWLKALSK